MMWQTMTVAGHMCSLLRTETPSCLLVQLMDEHDAALLEEEIGLLQTAQPRPFDFAAIHVQDWNQELSPWPAPPVFGTEGFGDGAADSLRLVEEEILPLLMAPLPQKMPVILGGYSLAGLFALWSAYQTARFAAVAAASPSVWFPGWLAWAESHTPQCPAIYLSLGDREEKTRNPVMAAVGDCIRQQVDLLAHEQGVKAAALRWEAGNHFRDVASRMAHGFAWAMDACLNM